MQKRDLRASDSMTQGSGVLPQSAEGNETTAASVAMRRVTIVAGLILSTTLAVGCSGDTHSNTGTGSGGAGGSSSQDAAGQDGLVTCARPNDPVDTYLPNMSKPGSNGVMTFTLVQSDHAPPIRDKNIWKLKIAKADQSPITGDVVPLVKMPLHTHPAGEQPKITYDASAGVYVADPVYFFMAGYWSAQFTVYEGPASNAEVVDRSAFYFCVD